VALRRPDATAIGWVGPRRERPCRAPNDRYGSCKPSFIQGCEEDEISSPGEDLYTFEELTNTDWPLSDYVLLKPYTEELCRKSCMEDYMCAVAIFRLGDSCWKKELPLSNGRVDIGLNNGKALIKIRKNNNFTLPGPRLPIPEPKKNDKDNSIIGSVLLGGSVFVNVILIGVICVGFFLIYRKKFQTIITKGGAVDMNLRCFTYKELVETTDGFKEELGKGAFGVVYKGVIQTGSTVLAVNGTGGQKFFFQPCSCGQPVLVLFPTSQSRLEHVDQTFSLPEQVNLHFRHLRLHSPRVPCWIRAWRRTIRA